MNAVTLKITGIKISPKILKQACGHIYTKRGDPSVLNTLCWSPPTAAYYSWLPRQIVTTDSESTATLVKPVTLDLFHAEQDFYLFGIFI